MAQDGKPTVGAAPVSMPEKNRHAAPINYPGDWVTSYDYPSPALRKELEGKTSFTLSLDKAGKIGQCKIIRSSGVQLLDEATCAIIKRRAQFQPALDSEGKAVEDSWTSSVRWQIPGSSGKKIAFPATPMNDPASWIRNNVWMNVSGYKLKPSEEFIKRRILTELAVDKAGKVVNCVHFDQYNLQPGFAFKNYATCQQFKDNARFEPLDDDKLALFSDENGLRYYVANIDANIVRKIY